MSTKKVSSSWIAVSGCIAAVSLTISGCGALSGDQPSDTVTLGAILPITGPISEWGESNRAILEMLEEEVNADGGVNGKKLNIVIYDSGGKAVEAANLVRKLATQDNALAIMGPFTSSEVEVAFPVANQLKLAITSQASSKPGLSEANRPWGFRNTGNEGTYLEAVVATVAKEIDPQRVAIAYDSSDSIGTTIGTVILPGLLGKAEIDVPNAKKPVTFSTTDIDLKSQVSILESLDSDAIGVGSFYNGAAKLIREMSSRGVKTPIFGGTPLVSANILEADPNIPIFSAGSYYPGIESAADWTKRAAAAFKKRKVPGAPTMFDTQVYETGLMYIQAMEEGDLTDKDLASGREGIRDFMSGLKDFKGVTSDISMGSTGDAHREFYVIRGEDGSWSISDTAAG